MTMQVASGWSVVGRDDMHAVNRAQRLASVLPADHYVDEQDPTGAVLRFFSYTDAHGVRGIGCVRLDEPFAMPATLGDATTTTTPAQGWSGMQVFAALLLGVFAGAGTTALVLSPDFRKSFG